MKNNGLKLFLNINKKIKLWAFIILITSTALLLVYSTFAWFRASVDAKIKNLNISSESHSDMLFSLDGINWSQTIDINENTVIHDLKKTYKNHINQWAKDGLIAISSNGMPNYYSNRFNLYRNTKYLYKSSKINNDTTINLELIKENESEKAQDFIAFDLFIKNETPSPYGDNLFISNDSYVINENGYEDANVDAMRIGFSITPAIDITSSINDIQNISCMVGCSQSIYEPNSNNHIKERIKELKSHGIVVKSDEYYPTYSVIKDGNDVSIWSGVVNSGKGLDYEHFDLQKTFTNSSEVLTILRNGISKMRVYIWLEAQDIDIIERPSNGTNVDIKLVFHKEMII